MCGRASLYVLVCIIAVCLTGCGRKSEFAQLQSISTIPNRELSLETGNLRSGFAALNDTRVAVVSENGNRMVALGGGVTLDEVGRRNLEMYTKWQEYVQTQSGSILPQVSSELDKGDSGSILANRDYDGVYIDLVNKYSVDILNARIAKQIAEHHVRNAADWQSSRANLELDKAKLRLDNLESARDAELTLRKQTKNAAKLDTGSEDKCSVEQCSTTVGLQTKVADVPPSLPDLSQYVDNVPAQGFEPAIDVTRSSSYKDRVVDTREFIGPAIKTLSSARNKSVGSR